MIVHYLSSLVSTIADFGGPFIEQSSTVIYAEPSSCLSVCTPAAGYSK